MLHPEKTDESEAQITRQPEDSKYSDIIYHKYIYYTEITSASDPLSASSLRRILMLHYI